MPSEKTIYDKNNNLKQLRGFSQLVRSGYITKAAERLFLSQPSITLQIQALEQELEATLFERHGPSQKLTPIGETLYMLAESLGDGMDDLQEKFAEHHGLLG